MAGRQALALLVGVRILLSQPAWIRGAHQLLGSLFLLEARAHEVRAVRWSC